MWIQASAKSCATEQRRGGRARLVMCRAATVMLLASLSGTAPGQTIVTIPDPSLSNAVRCALTQPGDPLTVTDLQELTCLFAPGQGINSLSGLEWASNLTALNLAGNSITDLSPLAGLSNLTSLDLGGNTISDLSALQHLTAMTSLMLYNNNLSDLTPLSGLGNLEYLEVRWNTISNCEAVLPAFTNLATLYLGGNSISNVAFLGALSRLTFLNLNHNWIQDVSPLAALTNLTGLDFGYNALTNLAQLSALTNLTSLYLSGSSLSDLSPLQNLGRLTSLTVYSNQIADLSPLGGLTNLSDLGLSWNPVTNLEAAVSGLTNLTGLWLAGHSLSNLAFLKGLTGLETLGLRNNSISNLAGLRRLTKLAVMDADYNRLTNNIEPVASLPRLLWAGLVGNSLNTNAGSSEMAVIQGLQARGVTVSYLPQNQPPSISVATNWIIAANATSSLCFYVSDDLTSPDGLSVAASSSEVGLIEEGNIQLNRTDYYRTLTVTPVTDQTGTTTIALTVTDEGGLSSQIPIQVTVMFATNVFFPDPNLEGAIRSALGKPEGELTSVDLLALTGLFTSDEDITDLTGLEWATNLTALYLEAGAITDLSCLSNLTQLALLSVSGNRIMDIAPLSGLTNLSYLNLGWNPITNLNEFLSGFTSVTSLELSGPSISDLSFLTNLTQLSSLNLYKTQVGDLSALAGLTKIQSLYLQQNRLTNILALTNLSQLSNVDLRLNLLYLDPGRGTGNTIRRLLRGGVSVLYPPQREPPSIAINTNWVITANATSWLYFYVSDNAASADFSVTASSSNTNLIPDANLAVGQTSTPNWIDWFLTVTPATNQCGTTTVTLTATNDAGLSTNVSILVTVDAPLPMAGEVFPDTNLTSWATGGDAPWFGQTNVSLGGVAAAQSGSSTNNGDSWLQVAVVGPGMLTFWWKVSSEMNYDFLSFYVGTNEEAQISGEVDWQQQTYNFAPGAYTLLWDYSKDQNNSRGLDAGWIAQVSFVPASWLQVAGGPTNGECTLDLWLPPGEAYEVQYSTNLADWFSLGAVTNTAAVTATNRFTDTNAASDARFYRMKTLYPYSPRQALP